MQQEYKVKGGYFVNTGIASSAVKSMLKQLDVPANLIKRVVVALYGAEVNVAAHAFEGKTGIAIFPGIEGGYSRNPAKAGTGY